MYSKSRYGRNRDEYQGAHRPFVQRKVVRRKPQQQPLIEERIGASAGKLLGGVLRGALSKVMGVGAYNLYRGPGRSLRSRYNAARPKKISGSGAYDIPAHSTVVTNVNSPPSFGPEKTIITHREYIGDVFSSTGFNLTKYDVNPGLETTFPWLSGLAINYEKYRPLGMVFEFKSTSANALNSTNTALGTVIMASRYNGVSESQPQSKMEMEQIENAISFCPAESGMHPIECALNFNPLNILYVRSGDTPAGQSEQFYDVCDFYIATQGMQAADVNIGELWVTYKIELITPVLSAGQVGDQINFANYTLGSGVTTSAYFNGASSELNVSNMELTFTGTTITMPENIVTGCYLLNWFLLGASGATSAPTVSFTNAAALPIFLGNTTSRPTSTAQTATSQSILQAFYVTGPGAVITFSGGTLIGSQSSGGVLITQLPGDLV